MASGNAGMMHNGWFTRPLTNVGGLNLPADLKGELGLSSGSVVFVRRFGPTLVIFPETQISPDTPMSASGLDTWVRSQIGAVAPPSAPAFPVAPTLTTEMHLIFQGKPVAPTQRAAPDQRLWTIPVDAKGHLTIPPELRRLLGQYGPGALLAAELRWDAGEEHPIPVVCFRAVTTTAQQEDLATQAALLIHHKQQMAAREQRLLEWSASVGARDAALTAKEEELAKRELRLRITTNDGARTNRPTWRDKKEKENNEPSPPPAARPGFKQIYNEQLKRYIEVADVDHE